MLIGLIIIMAGLVAMDALAARFGADTRDGRDWFADPYGG